MKITTIITSKIQPDIWKLIIEGKKRFELRTESFQNAGFIRYVSSEDGTPLSFHRIGRETTIPASNRDMLAALAGVDAAKVDELFPFPRAVSETVISTNKQETCTRYDRRDYPVRVVPVGPRCDDGLDALRLLDRLDRMAGKGTEGAK